MSTLLKKGLVPIFLIGAIFLTQMPTDATAKWRQNKDLPGLVSTKSLVLIGVGTASAIFLLAKLSKSGKASQAKAQGNSSFNRSTPSSFKQSSYVQSNPKPETSVPRVALFVDVNDYGVKGIDSFERSMNIKNKTISVGFSLGL